MTSKATVLNLLPDSDTDEDEIRTRLGVDEVILVPAVKVKELGARGGLEYLKKIQRDSKASVFGINAHDWRFQSNRTNLHGIACLVPASRRVAIDSCGGVYPLTWSGLAFGELPLSIAQNLSASHLIRKTKSLVDKNLAMERHYRTVPPGSIDRISYLRTDLWYGVKAGGSLGHVAGVIDGFIQSGVDVDVVSWDKPAMLNAKASFRKAAPSEFFINDREQALLAYNEIVTSTLAKNIRDFNPKAVYARYALHSWSPVTVADLLDVPLIIEYNGSEVWIEKNWGPGLRYPAIAAGIEDWVLRSADVISVVSRPLKDELVNRSFDERRILVNPNCVDTKRFDPSRFGANEISDLKRSLRIPESAVVAGFIGTFSPWHGVEVLANAIPAALSNCPKLHFLLIGDGPLFNQVRDKLRLSGSLDRVSLVGLVPQEQAVKYLMCSDFFLSPHVPNADGTPFFGSPTKLFEYMALGKGIIASDLDQLGEVLTDESNALLIPPGDAESLSKAIEHLYENPDLSNNLGAKARELALSQYTWTAHVVRVLDHLYSL